MNRETNRIKQYQSRLGQSHDPDTSPESIAYRARRGLHYRVWLAKDEDTRPPLASHMNLSYPRRLKLIKGGRA